MIVRFAGMCLTSRAHKIQKKLRLLPPRRGPPEGNIIGGHARFGARMHQRLHLPRDETIDDKKVFLNFERGVLAFEITCVVVPDAMAEYQILRSRRRSNRISLDKPQTVQRLL